MGLQLSPFLAPLSLEKKAYLNRMAANESDTNGRKIVNKE
jgi:hypothetical protein